MVDDIESQLIETESDTTETTFNDISKIFKHIKPHKAVRPECVTV